MSAPTCPLCGESPAPIHYAITDDGEHIDIDLCRACAAALSAYTRARTVKPLFGLNVNGEGETVGLWFDPAIVDVDEQAYVSLSYKELCQLSELIEQGIRSFGEA